MSQTVLILGGGVGGLVTANEVRKRLPREHRVVLVDRESSFVFAPSLLWLMTGGRAAEKISRPLGRLGRKGIEFVHGVIERIDPERREAIVDGRALSGDHLVIALGAELAPENVPGLAEAGFTFYSLDGAQKLQEALVRFSGGRLVVLTAEPVYKCPAAPYEAVMLLEDYCRRRGIREQTRIDLYAAESGPMLVAGPEVSRSVREMVDAKGIGYHPDHRVTSVNTAERDVAFANGARASYDLLIFVPPHRAPKAVRESGLCSESGWISVDRRDLATRFAGVYALGDIVSIPLTVGKPLPKAGVFAHGEAEVVARNIARAVRGRGTPAAFEGDGSCFIETGGGKAGYGKGNFYAEPVPQVTIHAPSWRWHAAKILFEKYWLRRWC